MLGIAEPKGPFLERGFPDDKEFNACLDGGPIRAAEHEKIAAWVEANKGPLDVIVKASERSRWYCPAVVGKEDEYLVAIRLPAYVSLLRASRMLIIRAKLATGAGRASQCRNDLQAVQRLASVVGQDHALIARMVGITLEILANRAYLTIATSGKLNAKLIRELGTDLAAAPPLPAMAPAVDEGERYVVLDILCHWSASPPEEIADGLPTLMAVGTNKRPNKLGPEERKTFMRLATAANWDADLRLANRYFDRMVGGMNAGDLKEREAAYKACTDILVSLSKPKLSDYDDAGQICLRLMLVSVGMAQSIRDQNCVRRDLSIVALALAAYKAEKGKYPEKLQDLSPDYLKTLPKDFYSGKDFLYKLKGSGFVVYSVGEDGKDDGGVEEGATGKPDIVVKSES